MKIAFLMTQSLDSPSGLGRFGPIARELVRLGHDIEFLALHPNWSEVAPRSFNDAGVRVKYVGQMHVSKKGPRKLYYGPVRLLAISFASTLRMAKALWRSDAELIQICKPQPYNVLAAKLGGRGRPIYCDCDDYEAESNRFSSRWQKTIVHYFEDGIVRYVRAISTNTRFTRQRYAALGFPVERMVYVPNGVERRRFDITIERQQLEQMRRTVPMLDPDAPIILYVGTLGLASHPVDLLLKAFRYVVDEVPQAQLLIVGGGEDYDSLVALSQELGIDGRTHFTGRITPETVPLYYAMSSLTVDPVYDDNVARARSPLKIVESLTMGKPVVTSDVGDRRAFINSSEDGILVPPGNSEALAGGLLQLIRYENQRKRSADQILDYSRKWFWDKLVKDFVRVYSL